MKCLTICLPSKDIRLRHAEETGHINKTSRQKWGDYRMLNLHSFIGNCFETVGSVDLGLGKENYKTAWAEPEPIFDWYFATSTSAKIYGFVQLNLLHIKRLIRGSNSLWPLLKKFRSLYFRKMS